MRKNNAIKYIFIIVAAVLISNVIQFYVFNQNNMEQKDDTLPPIYESKANLYTDYSSGVQNIYRYLVNLNNAHTRTISMLKRTMQTSLPIGTRFMHY